MVLRGGGKTDKHYEYNQIYNYKLFDSDYVSDESLLAYYDREFRKFGARFMQAYPSSVYRLAKSYLAAGKEAPSFDAIFLGSENVLQDQLDLIGKCFQPKAIHYNYGHSEEVLLGIKYSDQSGYGFMPQYGYCEVVNPEGRTVGAYGSGELTGTSWSKKMPFIRYRTNDFATLGGVYVDDRFPYHSIHIERIEGRRQEFVVRGDGTQVSIVSICSEHMPVMSKIKEMQFEQHKAGELSINCVFYEGSDKEAISSEIVSAMEKRFEGMVNCHVQEVPKVRKTNNGKTIMLIQHIKRT